MKPVLALKMWFLIQYKKAGFKFFRFAYTVAITVAASCHQPPELCVSASLRFLLSFFSQA